MATNDFSGRTMTAAEVARELLARASAAVGRAAFERLRASLLVLVSDEPAAVAAVTVVRWGDDREASAEGLAVVPALWSSLVARALSRDLSLIHI